jgi:hypothetical protein
VYIQVLKWVKVWDAQVFFYDNEQFHLATGRATLFTYPGQTPRPPLAKLLDQKQKKASKTKKANIVKKIG